MKSMTGYGRAAQSENGWSLVVEANSVNRKQLEVAVTLPRELSSLEPRLRELASSRLSRGRINLAISSTRASSLAEWSPIDPDAAATALAALRQLQGQLGVGGDISLSLVLSVPGVVRVPGPALGSQEQDALWPLVEKASIEALEALIAMRQEEGNRLTGDLRERIHSIATHAARIRELHPAVIERYRAALTGRLQKAGLDVALDDERVLKEIVLFVDRCDIAEELTRLDSHFQQFHQLLASNEPVGRTLEFLIQEIGRELNTLGAKGNDATISGLVVACKSEMEKIREQVQNIE